MLARALRAAAGGSIGGRGARGGDGGKNRGMSVPRKSLMRSLGEFFGHVRAGMRAPVPREEGERTVVRKETEERREGNVVLRRTVVEEVEIRGEGEGTRSE